MTPAEAVVYLRRIVAVERQALVKPKLTTTPYIEALELAIAVLEEAEP